MIKLNAVLHTDGTGLWSTRKTAVRVCSLELGYVCELGEHGELRVYFDEDTWNTDVDGLIYTDELFGIELLNLLTDYGIQGSVCYSEQGMQGYDYVSFDVDAEFISEFNSIGMPA